MLATDQLITTPGVYELPFDAYLADPVEGGSLSASGARKLMRCAARFKYDRDHPGEVATKAFDVGHAAHQLVLGAGPELVLVDRDRWDTNAVKDEVAAIREAGNVPLKPSQYEQVHAMAAALRQHDVASTLFSRGRPEQTLVWRDRATGVMCRARLDWLPDHPGPGQRMLLPDYKTADSADPEDLPRAVHSYGYALQGAWYLDGVEQLGLSGPVPAFLLVVQEKEPPYLVTVTNLTMRALHIGAIWMRQTRQLYAECMASGIWPGYADDIVETGLPYWVEAQYESEFRR